MVADCQSVSMAGNLSGSQHPSVQEVVTDIGVHQSQKICIGLATPCDAHGKDVGSHDGSTISAEDQDAPGNSSSRRSSSPGTPPAPPEWVHHSSGDDRPEQLTTPQLAGDQLGFGGQALASVSGAARSSRERVPAAEEAEVSGFWEVIGGSDKGGIIVRNRKELGSPQGAERLATGSLIKELLLEDGRLRYVLLEGAGPKTGWISVKAGGRELATRSRRRPAAPEQRRPAAPRQPEADPRKHAGPSQSSSKPGIVPEAAEPPQRASSSGARPEEAVEVEPPRGDLVASLQYLVHDGRNPFFYLYQREDGGEQTHGRFESSEVRIFDGRAEAETLSLDRHGVMLVPHRTSLSTYDFYERPDKIWGQYYKEMRELIQHVTGASRVIVFDHNIRNPREARWRRGVIGYVPYAHNDYTDESAPKRVRDVARPRQASPPADEPVVWEDEIEELLQRRYVIINVWRNISDAPIAADPLAVADGRTVKDEGYIPTDLIYRDRTGQTYSVTEDPDHRWLYFSGMRKDEAILLKCFDSQEHPDRVRWTAHTGFIDPRSPPDAPQRESIDSRCIAFFDEGDAPRTAEEAASLFPGALAAATGPLMGEAGKTG